ncbi:MAG: DPP IV N-terminal domain-containing protein [Bacteroidetes bacterium]|nr:DPP IV N-terminal domain-containing protein [Bacteroidota bacterium]MBS1973763.1 DPP IV N-terminal domain-containing protein [Bacteroidota bacterium]
MLGENARLFTDYSDVFPNWISGDKFWYRILNAQGSEFVLADPVKGTRNPAFNHQKLASIISAATGVNYDAYHLPFRSFSFSEDGKTIYFEANGQQWQCDLINYKCSSSENTAKSKLEATDDEVLSPDGKKAAFIKDYNLWARDLSSGKETQLTTDGIKDFGYATDNAGWKSSDAPVLCWSPDSKKIATFKQDQRKVGDMYLVATNVGRPVLKAWKYPLPGDKDIITIHRVIINVDEPKVIFLQCPPDPHRASLSDDIASSGTFDDVSWGQNGSALAFLSTSRDHKQEKLRIANAVTGAVRDIFAENVKTQYESGQGAINWKYLQKSDEIIWYSERDNWGHLYLYDAQTGKLKNQITKGDFVVTRLLKIDEKKRQLYFMANGREPGNPYFSHFYRINFDGNGFTLLTPENGNHEITLTPSGLYFIDSYSQPDVPAITVMRNLDGKIVTVLERMDISRLLATGWRLPMPFTVKAHDGKTDLYGLMYAPANLDPNKKYPIVDYIYPGPQGGSVGSWSFTLYRGDNQALAQLGFIVVEIEGTSNPLRSKSFHDMSYGNMAENTIPDQISGIKQLSQRYSYMDTNRVGIWGHSGGGFATATAMFRYPDFFKVGISESGNHDNRNYEDDWGERYNGLVTESDYDAQANENYAKNLKGKLLLAHGLMDDNVPPSNTMLVVEALEKANKDFDLIVFPNSRHGYGEYSYYMMRHRWDYFVKNLQGTTPPENYKIKIKPDPRNRLE